MRAMSSASVTHLNLWKQNLGSVPESVCNTTDLETLVLADNALTNVPSSIGNLKKLRMLDLGHNLLDEVPAALGDLDNLSDFLYLHDNRSATCGSCASFIYDTTN
jgi:Leucine-rich repeat (LRR) protein